MEHGSGGDGRSGMFVRTHSPQLFACGSVQRVHVSRGIAKKDRRIARDFSRRDSRANLRLNHGGPVDAAGRRVEGVYAAVLAADENPAAIHSRLRAQRGRIREGEGPLQSEAGNGVSLQAGLTRRKETRVGEPASPTGPASTVFPGGVRQAGVRDLITSSFYGHGGAQKVRDLLAFVAVKRRCLRFHDAALDGPKNRGGRHGLQCGGQEKIGVFHLHAPAPGWRTAWEYISTGRRELRRFESSEIQDFRDYV